MLHLLKQAARPVLLRGSALVTAFLAGHGADPAQAEQVAAGLVAALLIALDVSVSAFNRRAR